MRFLTSQVPTFNRPQKEVVRMEVVRKQIIRGIFIFLIVSNVFLFLRFFLRLFGADPENFFAGLIFMISTLFLLPFFGIFPNSHDGIIAGEMAVDSSAMVAGFCYNILGVLAMIVVQIGTAMLRTNKQADASVEKGKPINTQTVDQTFNHHQP
ncbi:MAG: YggT family protein [Candidatus Levybacteria bacterium]|nr:YggT family protein [Candidatus Levybacteria bacterium]